MGLGPLAYAAVIPHLGPSRDALLPRLISGKLKVDHLDIRLPPSMQTVATA
jgi:type I restriction enzyme S subunit